MTPLEAEVAELRLKVATLEDQLREAQAAPLVMAKSVSRHARTTREISPAIVMRVLRLAQAGGLRR